MLTAHAQLLLDRLDAMRAELIDLAFSLDCRGNPAAADVAMSTSARLGELREEFARASVDEADFKNRAATCPE